MFYRVHASFSVLIRSKINCKNRSKLNLSKIDNFWGNFFKFVVVNTFYKFFCSKFPKIELQLHFQKLSNLKLKFTTFNSLKMYQITKTPVKFRSLNEGPLLTSKWNQLFVSNSRVSDIELVCYCHVDKLSAL